MRARQKPKKTTPGKHRHTICLTDPKVEEFAKAKAKNEHEDKMSRYVRALIRKDMEAAPATK